VNRWPRAGIERVGTAHFFTLRQPTPLEEQEARKRFESAFEIILPVKSREVLDDVFLFMDEQEYSTHPIEPIPATGSVPSAAPKK